LRVSLDANVLFAAAWSAGAVRRLLRGTAVAGNTLVADGYVWEEARRNLLAHGSARLAELHRLSTAMELHTHHAGSTITVDELHLADKDVPVLGSAIALECDTLVTGDRTHFGSLWGTEVCAVLVVSPVMLAKLI